MFVAELKEALMVHSLSDFSFKGWLRIVNLDIEEISSLKQFIRVVHEFRMWMKDIKNPHARL
jgi:hypothetical protein